MKLFKALRSNLVFPVCALLILIVAGCEKEKVKVDYSGTVVNTFDRPVQGATITVAGPTPTSGTTDASGLFSLNFEEGTYTVTVSATGYIELVETITLTSSSGGVTLQLSGEASISGTLNDSQSTGGKSGATIYFSTGSDTPTASDFDFSVVTSTGGSYSVANAPAVAVKGLMQASGYHDRTFTATLIAGSNSFVPVVLVAKPTGSAIRIVSHWRNAAISGLDLDMHVTGPIFGSGLRFHAYYGSTNPNSTVTVNVAGGSSGTFETTTLNSLVSGTYRIRVYNYSNPTPPSGGQQISSALCTVEIYDATSLMSGVVAAGTPGFNTWRAFELIVSAGLVVTAINPINTYYSVADDDDGNEFRTSGKVRRFRESDF